MKTNLIEITLEAVAFASVILTCNSNAQLQMSPGNYSRDFNALPTADSSWTDNSTLLGWYASTNGGIGRTVTTIKASPGSSTSSSLYSYGASGDSDRELGSRQAEAQVISLAAFDS
jgi:hypothetical protein